MLTRRHLAGYAVVSLILGLLLSLTVVAAQAATTIDPNGCRAPKVPVDSTTTTCPDKTPSTAPSSSSVPQAGSPTPGGAEKNGGRSDAGGGVQFGQDEEPTGWAGPIAK